MTTLVAIFNEFKWENIMAISLFDLFKIIYADHKIDEPERKTLLKYALGLGFTSDKAESVVKKSIKIFEEGIDFDHYSFLMDKRSTD